MRATVAAAKGHGNVPMVLTMYWMAKSEGQALEAGGFMDQDWGTIVAVRYLDHVYRTVGRWAKGKPSMEQDSQLILRLTQQGMMGSG